MSSEMKRGQPITFRVPSDTPDHIVKHLQQLKETERRNFSSKMAEYVIEGVNQSYSKQKETITVPLPKGLNKSQRDWLKHEQSQALLGNIVYQLLSDPVRTASLISSMNHGEIEMKDYIDFNEEIASSLETEKEQENVLNKKVEVTNTNTNSTNYSDDDLDNFDWSTAAKPEIDSNEQEDNQEEDLDDLLGGFLAQMND
jgi:hypothetical protein